jgi:hypothetical protein
LFPAMATGINEGKRAAISSAQANRQMGAGSHKTTPDDLEPPYSLGVSSREGLFLTWHYRQRQEYGGASVDSTNLGRRV